MSLGIGVRELVKKDPQLYFLWEDDGGYLAVRVDDQWGLIVTELGRLPGIDWESEPANLKPILVTLSGAEDVVKRNKSTSTFFLYRADGSIEKYNLEQRRVYGY